MIPIETMKNQTDNIKDIWHSELIYDT